MATLETLRNHVRLELGDIAEHFRESFRGTGEKDDWDLPARNVDTVTVYQVDNNDALIPFVENTDFTVDRGKGVITFSDPPEEDALLVVEGTNFGIFNNDEVDHFISAAAGQHLFGRTVERRYRDGHGFIRYDNEPMDLEDLPKEEEILVTLLTTIEALWALSTDASLDIDVRTAESTDVPRGQRYRQLTAQIDLLTDKYKDISLMLGVGLYAPEVMDMRRVSRTTGRLVPIFRPREYDETGEPQRKLPDRSTRDLDRDGPRNPFWSGGWGY